MKKLLFFTFLVLILIDSFAQNHLINFLGKGASSLVDSIRIENLTLKTSLTIKGSDFLKLLNTTGINNFDLKYEAPITCPNPFTNFTELIFNTKNYNNVSVKVYDLSGKLILQLNKYLKQGTHQYRISGLTAGVYLLSISSKDYCNSVKLISKNHAINNPKIINNSLLSLNDEILRNTIPLKSLSSTIVMHYNTGNVLKFTGYSNNHRTVIIDSPTSDKIIIFNFFKCSDNANKEYSVVQIGNQVWMAENLSYLPTVSLSLDTSNSIAKYYVYGYEGINTNEAKLTTNYKTYGVLYNWPAAFAACPIGWRLPPESEWKELSSYISNHGYNEDEAFKAKFSFGFAALLGGCLSKERFNEIEKFGYWWTSTEYEQIVNYWNSWYLFPGLSWGGIDYKSTGFSVRCIKDDFFNINTTLNLNIPVSVSSTKSNGGSLFPFTKTDTFMLLTENKDVVDYVDRFKSVTIHSISASILGLTPGQIIEALTISVNQVGTILTLANITSTSVLTPNISSTLLSQIGTIIDNYHSITVTVTGSANYAPMAFNLNLALDATVEAWTY